MTQAPDRGRHPRGCRPRRRFLTVRSGRRLPEVAAGFQPAESTIGFISRAGPAAAPVPRGPPPSGATPETRAPNVERLGATSEPACRQPTGHQPARISFRQRLPRNSRQGRISMPGSARRGLGARQTRMHRLLGCSSCQARRPLRWSLAGRSVDFTSTATSALPRMIKR